MEIKIFPILIKLNAQNGKKHYGKSNAMLSKKMPV